MEIYGLWTMVSANLEKLNFGSGSFESTVMRCVLFVESHIANTPTKIVQLLLDSMDRSLYGHVTEYLGSYKEDYYEDADTTE